MNTEHDISIILIGCGGFFHRYHRPAIEADAAARIVAIFDPQPSDETRQFAARTGAVLLDRLDALPRPAGTVMAIVTTPHTLHAGHVRFALDRSWHVLCDKPFVMHAAEAQALARLAAERKLTNAVAFNRRFDRGCQAARRIIAEGGIGPVRYVEAVQLGYEHAGWFLDPALGGGGPYTGRASHMADLVPWLIGRAPTRLRSRLRGDGGPRSDRGGFIELRFGELECHFTCVEEGWHGWDELRIFGETGLIELRRPLTEKIGWALWHWSDRGEALRFLEADPSPGGSTRDFLAALRGAHDVSCSFAEALTSVAVVEAAFLSARNGERWLDLPTDDALGIASVGTARRAGA